MGNVRGVDEKKKEDIKGLYYFADLQTIPIDLKSTYVAVSVATMTSCLSFLQDGSCMG